jgi:AcrR family transcriptional regulator
MSDNHRKSKGSGAQKKGSYHHGDLRATLLKSAGSVLEEKGLEGFSLRAVAKHAGVSHAAPAHHFDDTNGLLTTLAAEGYRQFVIAQEQRQKKALPDARAQLIASGLGYIDFAMRKPALYRLMFSSNRPDHSSEDLSASAHDAFQKLLNQVHDLTGSNPETESDAMLDVLAIWSMVHGLADLLNANRLKPLICLAKAPRERALSNILDRALPP